VSRARSVWFSAPRTVELREAQVGDPGEGEVLVEAELSGLSAGTELLAYRGLAPDGLRPDLPTVEGDFGFPIKFGYACVGRVLDVGPGAALPTMGQRVFALHPHQSRFLIPSSLTVPLPDEIEPAAGIFFANLETAFNVLLDAHPRLGEHVAVFGQGTVGLLITRLLRLAGVGLIVAVDPLARRRSAALRLGADLALDPSKAGAAALRELGDGRGLDLAVEASGVGSALQTAIDAVAFQGTVVVCAWYGSKPITLDLGSRFHRERVRVVSSQVSSLDPAITPRWDRDRRTAAVRDLLRRLPELAGLITHRFPLSRAGEAYRLLDERPGEAIQIAFGYDER
jgi:2-desacetyl-2-hydroxyethyl bacteriochlorophyllide A dehydrogenase